MFHELICFKLLGKSFQPQLNWNIQKCIFLYRQHLINRWYLRCVWFQWKYIKWQKTIKERFSMLSLTVKTWYNFQSVVIFSNCTFSFFMLKVINESLKISTRLKIKSLFWHKWKLFYYFSKLKWNEVKHLFKPNLNINSKHIFHPFIK